MRTTTDQEFASAERSDRLLARVLGESLDRATLRLGLMLLAFAAIGAALAMMAP